MLLLVIPLNPLVVNDGNNVQLYPVVLIAIKLVSIAYPATKRCPLPTEINPEKLVEFIPATPLNDVTNCTFK